MSPFWLGVRGRGAPAPLQGGCRLCVAGASPPRLRSHGPWVSQGITRPSRGRCSACGRACILRLALEETVPASGRAQRRSPGAPRQSNGASAPSIRSTARPSPRSRACGVLPHLRGIAVGQVDASAAGCGGEGGTGDPQVSGQGPGMLGWTFGERHPVAPTASRVAAWPTLLDVRR